MRATLATTASALLLVVALAGCGSEAKDLADGGLKKAACSAITKVDGDLAKAEDASPEELQTLKTKAQAAQTALKAAGDKVPAEVMTKVDDATKQLSEAADSAKADASADKAKVKDATDQLSSALDEASTKLSC